MTTTQTAAFLPAILETPDDDFVRLAYADLLEEEGEYIRAEFIRVQVERANVQRRLDCDLKVAGTYSSLMKRFGELRRRERDLLRSEFAIPIATAFGIPQGRAENGGAYFSHSGTLRHWPPVGNRRRQIYKGQLVDDGPIFWTFRRGFVAVVNCCWDDWLEFGPAVVRVEPVERLELLGVPPMNLKGIVLPATTGAPMLVGRYKSTSDAALAWARGTTPGLDSLAD